MNVQDASVHKDIESALLNSGKRRRRKPGDIAYPPSHSSSLLDVENWDHVFRQTCLRSRISLVEIPVENWPKRVLDLGCGSGLWVLEAAKAWPDALIYGYDCLQIQPGYLQFLFPPNSTAPDRIKWVHGNFLEGLPFQSDYFDFVRITMIGLGVPEDEWQDLLEEVHRVMAPGGSIEITEEDLIFPCAPVPEKATPRASLSKLNLDFSGTDSFASTTLHSEGSFSRRSSITIASDVTLTPSGDEDLPDTPLTKRPSLSPLPESPTDQSPSTEAKWDEEDVQYGQDSSRGSFTPPPTPHISSRPSLDEDQYDRPHDHTRVKSAWEAMLSRRFITPKLGAVMPFYISSIFEQVMTHPPVEIELPPNSSMYRRSTRFSIGRQSEDSKLTGSSSSSSNNRFFNPPKSGSSDRMIPHWQPEDYSADKPDAIRAKDRVDSTSIPAWASMHLAKSMQTIIECREAIWEEYAILYHSEQSVFPPAIVRSPKSGFDFRRKSILSTTYEAFEHEWKNWENDMMDRIAFRKHIEAELSWKEPLGDRPDWRVWRSNMDVKGIPEHGGQNDPPNICRAMRAFMAKKPTKSPEAKT